VLQTICTATKERQESLIELLQVSDAVIITGGKESANTRRLFDIAKKSGKPCVLAQNASCIPDNFFKFETVGIAAGASTPDTVIDDIEEALLNGG
jgi:4-hydroxy-3-methylbut-2-enyl diphosphate reductase